MQPISEENELQALFAHCGTFRWADRSLLALQQINLFQNVLWSVLLYSKRFQVCHSDNNPMDSGGPKLLSRINSARGLLGV